MDSVEAYSNARRRITDLLRAHGDAGAKQRVASCPNWTVREVASHLVGVTADALAGNLQDAGTDPWTEAQVDKRRGLSLEQILAEWDETGPQLEKAIAGAGSAANQLVFDTATHEHDIRHALDAPGAQDADSTHIALDFAIEVWSGNLTNEGFEPLRLNAGNKTVVAGVGDPVATVAMPRVRGAARPLRPSFDRSARRLRLGRRPDPVAALLHLRSVQATRERHRRVAGAPAPARCRARRRPAGRAVRRRAIRVRRPISRLGPCWRTSCSGRGTPAEPSRSDLSGAWPRGSLPCPCPVTRGCSGHRGTGT